MEWGGRGTMSTISSSPVYGYHGSRLIRDAATAIFTILIALLGAAMMTVTSSPLMKGASFLWLPAALQLIAGVWLGPIRGFIAGGIGAQAASVIAYGGLGASGFHHELGRQRRCQFVAPRGDVQVVEN